MTDNIKHNVDAFLASIDYIANPRVKYTSEGFRAVYAETMKDAAKVFAERLARREFGRVGYCRTLGLVGWTENGACGHFNAFIGKPAPGNPGCTTGRNARFTVYREKT